MSQVEYGPLAGLYDFINQEYIDYEGQSRFVTERLRKWGVGAGRVLDLGCATGQHALRLVRAGYRVVGADTSVPLLRKARQRLARRREATVLCCDIRHLCFGAAFDAAVCLNHTVNYMVGDDLGSALAGVRRALVPGGVLLVDFFDYGPVREWNATWRECAERDGVRVETLHRMKVDGGRRSATDVHVYVVTREGRRQTFRGVDCLRITTVKNMAEAIAGAGFEIAEAGMKSKLGMSDTDKAGLIVALRR
ncbi:MAG: class I SAM-dependent methyltransferase [Armatimonadota bacterium]